MSVIKLATEDVVNITEQVKEAKGFEVGNEQMLMEIIQNSQYMYPFRSVIRELVSNGMDAIAEKKMAINILAGKNQESDYFIERNSVEAKHSHFDSTYYDLKFLQDENKVKITYHQITDAEDYLTIEDSGVGLSPIRLFAVTNKVGYSTKRNNKDQIGGYGCGSKVPFSLTELPYFTIETSYNGMYMRRKVFKQYSTEDIQSVDESTFYLKLESNNGEEIKPIKYIPTEAKNYTRITIPCKKFWKKEFDLAVKTQLLYCQEVDYVIEINGIPTKQQFLAKKMYNSEHIILSDNAIYGKPHVLIVKNPKDLDRTEAICYGFINYTEMESVTPDGAIGIVCTIRQVILDEEGNEIVIQEGVEVNPSRETIRYTQHTKEYISKKMDSVATEANNIIKSIIDKEKDYLTWLSLAYQLMTDKYTAAKEDSLLVLKRLKAVATNITFSSKVQLNYTDDLLERTVFEESPQILVQMNVDIKRKEFQASLQGLDLHNLMPFITISQYTIPAGTNDELDYIVRTFYSEDFSPEILAVNTVLKDCTLNTEKMLRILKAPNNKIKYQVTFTPPSKETLQKAVSSVLAYSNYKGHKDSEKAKEYYKAEALLQKYLLFLVIKPRFQELLQPLSVVLASEIANPSVKVEVVKEPELTPAQKRKLANKGIIYYLNIQKNTYYFKSYCTWATEEINISDFTDYLVNANRLAKAQKGTYEYDKLEVHQYPLQKKIEPMMSCPMFPTVDYGEPIYIGDKKPETSEYYEVLWAILHRVIVGNMYDKPFPIYLMAQNHSRDLEAPTFLPIKNYLKGFLFKQPLEEGQTKQKICYMFPEHLRKASTLYLISTRMNKYKYLTNYKVFDEAIFKKFFRILEYTGIFENLNMGSIKDGLIKQQVEYSIVLNQQVVTNIKATSLDVFKEFTEKQHKLIEYQYQLQTQLDAVSDNEEATKIVREQQVDALSKLFKTTVDDFMVVDKEILTLIIELDAYMERLGNLFLKIELMSQAGEELPVEFISEMKEYISFKLSQTA